MERPSKEISMAWGDKQYSKIQDYVIHSGLVKKYLGDSNLSHADMLIQEVKRLQKKCQAYEGNIRTLLSKLEK